MVLVPKTGSVFSLVGEETGSRWAGRLTKCSFEPGCSGQSRLGFTKCLRLRFLFLAVWRLQGRAEWAASRPPSVRTGREVPLSLWVHPPALVGNGALDKPNLTCPRQSSLLQNKLWVNTELRVEWQAGVGRGRGGAAAAGPGVGGHRRGHLAGHLHGLGPRTVPSGTGVGRDV